MSSSKKLTSKRTLRQVFIRVYRLEMANFWRTFSHIGIFNPSLWSVVSPVVWAVLDTQINWSEFKTLFSFPTLLTVFFLHQCRTKFMHICAPLNYICNHSMRKENRKYSITIIGTYRINSIYKVFRPPDTWVCVIGSGWHEFSVKSFYSAVKSVRPARPFFHHRTTHGRPRPPHTAELGQTLTGTRTL